MKSAIDQMKAIHAAGGTPLTDDEVLEFITRPIWMGAPKVPERPPGTAGPKPKRTQYDLAFDRRKDLYRKRVKLPAFRPKGSAARRLIGARTHERLLRLAMEAGNVAPHKRVSEMIRIMHKCGGVQHDPTTLRRWLLANGG